MHEEIIRYQTSGTISEESLEQTKESLVHFLEESMKDDGVVPSLDLDPGFTLEYDAERDEYNFELSVYGVYVGKEGALWSIAGITSGRKVMKHTPLAKSKAS